MKRTHVIVHTLGRIGSSTVEELYLWHVIENGWRDIGYHWYVTKSGEIIPCRPESINGAHCAAGGMNEVSIGVAFEGHGDYEDWTGLQSEKGLDLIRNICWRYNIPSSNVEGHNEYDKGKTCPGERIDMDKVRKKVAVMKTGMI